MTVCSMQPAHIASAAALLQNCFPGGPAEESVIAGLENPANRYFCAVKDGCVVGCAGYSAAADQADVIEVAVLLSCRRQGIARMLMEAILTDARLRGVQTIFLEVRVSNAPAIALYASLSFTRCGVRKNYYASPREDALLMCRGLSHTDV